MSIYRYVLDYVVVVIVVVASTYKDINLTGKTGARLYVKSNYFQFMTKLQWKKTFGFSSNNFQVIFSPQNVRITQISRWICFIFLKNVTNIWTLMSQQTEDNDNDNDNDNTLFDHNLQIEIERCSLFLSESTSSAVFGESIIQAGEKENGLKCGSLPPGFHLLWWHKISCIFQVISR